MCVGKWKSDSGKMLNFSAQVRLILSLATMKSNEQTTMYIRFYHEQYIILSRMCCHCRVKNTSKLSQTPTESKSIPY